ncbi:hypothetical protein M9458_004749, partial [Cirrhinus mrigala]
TLCSSKCDVLCIISSSGMERVFLCYKLHRDETLCDRTASLLRHQFQQWPHCRNCQQRCRGESRLCACFR